MSVVRPSIIRGQSMDELETLKRKLKAREGRKGYAENVEAIKRRIAELEGQNGG